MGTNGGVPPNHIIKQRQVCKGLPFLLLSDIINKITRKIGFKNDQL